MIKSVAMDLDLHLQIQQLEDASKSLKKTKKRLQEAELTLNLRPHDGEELYLVDAWEKKCDALIATRDVLPFPSRKEIQKVWAKKAMEETIGKKTNKNYMTREMWEAQNNRIVERQLKKTKENILNRGKAFGGHGYGSVLKTVEPYNGLNSIYSGSRPIIKRQGNGLKDNTESSLPPWFHPQYYQNTEKPGLKHSDKHYKRAFISVSREGTGLVMKELSNISRRKGLVGGSASLEGCLDTWGSSSLIGESLISSVAGINSDDEENEENDKTLKNQAAHDDSCLSRPVSQSSRHSVDTPKSRFGFRSVIRTVEPESRTRKLLPKVRKEKTMPKQFKVKDYLADALKYQTPVVIHHDFEEPLTVDEFDEFGEPIVTSGHSKPTISEVVSNPLLLPVTAAAHRTEQAAAELSPIRFSSDIFRVKNRPKSAAGPQSLSGTGKGTPGDRQQPGVELGSAASCTTAVSVGKDFIAVLPPHSSTPAVEEEHDVSGCLTVEKAGENGVVDTALSRSTSVEVTTTPALPISEKLLSTPSSVKRPPSQKKLSETAAKAERDAILARPMAPINIPKIPPRRPTETRKQLNGFVSARCKNSSEHTSKFNVDVKSRNAVAEVDNWIEANGGFSSGILSWRSERKALRAELVAVSTPVSFDAKGAGLLLLDKNPYTADDPLIKNNANRDTHEFIL